MLIFPDTSDLFWESCATQVPAEEMDDHPMKERHRKPWGFVSGAVEGSELWQLSMDREAFAVVSMFKRCCL